MKETVFVFVVKMTLVFVAVFPLSLLVQFHSTQ